MSRPLSRYSNNRGPARKQANTSEAIRKKKITQTNGYRHTLPASGIFGTRVGRNRRRSSDSLATRSNIAQDEPTRERNRRSRRAAAAAAVTD